MLLVDHQAFGTPEAYLELAQRMIDLAGVEEKIIGRSHQPAKILLETADTIFEVAFDKRFDFLDRRFIPRFNEVLTALGQQQLFYFVWPESILKQDAEKLSLAFASGEQLTELIQKGYVKLGT